MSAWKNEVCLIEKIEKHPAADRIEIAIVLGDFPVIVKKGQYQVGEKVAYISIDTIFPDVEKWHYLTPLAYKQVEDSETGAIKNVSTGFKYNVGEVPENKRILKSKRMFGVYSQGLITDAPEHLNVGDSVVEYFGLTKWDEPEEDAKLNSGLREKTPAGWTLGYYDIEPLRSNLKCFENFEEEIVISEKLHGSWTGYSFLNGQFVIKSRTQFRKHDNENSWSQAANIYNLEEKFAKYPNFAFCGELVGYQKGFKYDTVNGDGKFEVKLYFFDIYDLDNRKFLDYDEFVRICEELDLKRAHELYRGVWTSKEDIYQFAEGMTTHGSKHVREGFVIKPTKEQFSGPLRGRFLLKHIGEGYNLKK